LYVSCHWLAYSCRSQGVFLIAKVLVYLRVMSIYTLT
jgi:hypothetical protein